jgi:hypothetical protein
VNVPFSHSGSWQIAGNPDPNIPPGPFTFNITNEASGGGAPGISLEMDSSGTIVTGTLTAEGTYNVTFSGSDGASGSFVLVVGPDPAIWVPN